TWRIVSLVSDDLGLRNSTSRGAVAPITLTKATSSARAVSEIPSQPCQSSIELQWTHFLAPCFIGSRQTRHGTVISAGFGVISFSGSAPGCCCLTKLLASLMIDTVKTVLGDNNPLYPSSLPCSALSALRRSEERRVGN